MDIAKSRIVFSAEVVSKGNNDVLTRHVFCPYFQNLRECPLN